MEYQFTKHAREKFKDLEKYGFHLTEDQIMEALKEPDRVERGSRGRKIAQKGISKRHVLRVIYEETEDSIKIITFYPGRRDRYEG